MAEIRTPFPLTWPASWPRARFRTDAPFHRKVTAPGKSYPDKKPTTMAQSRSELQRQLDLLGAKDILLSTNVELNLNGEPRGDRARPVDVGVAVYFKLKGRDTVLACDKWLRVEDNIVAICKHIDALRGQERWGVGSIEQAFTGYQALPAPLAKRHWTSVLKLGEHATIDEINAAWKALAREAAGDETKLLDANMAKQEALAARSLT